MQFETWGESLSTRRTLVWDIENLPHIALTYEIWQTNIRREGIIEEGRVPCFGAKWLGEDGVYFYGEDEYTHEGVAAKARELLDQADRVISYNGVSFDTKKINGDFLKLGIKPPSSYVEVDLYRAGKKRFSLPFHGLNDLAELLGLAGKLKVSMLELSKRIRAGDPDAWAEMRAYNIQDVLVTEQVYKELIPWL